MSIELGAAYVSILPSTDKLAPAIKSELGKVSTDAGGHGERSGRSFGDRFKSALGGVVKKGAVAGLAGASLLGGAGLKTAAELEQSRIGFETMLGSAKAAEDFMSQIKRTAAQTPFELPGLTSASQKLLAFGFGVKDVIPTLTTLGDAAAGLGVGQAGLDKIILAVGQIQAKGKVQSDELLQLTESGIPALKILANEFGVTTGEMQEMVTKGLVPAEKAIPALLGGIKNGTKGAAGETAKFGGLMEKQAQSLTGLASTLKDTVLVGLAEGIEPLIPTLKDGLAGAIERVGPALESGSRAVATFVDEMKSGEGTGGAFADVLKTTYAAGKGILDLFLAIPGPVRTYGAALAVAYLATSKLRSLMSPAVTSLSTFATGLSTAEGRARQLASTSARMKDVGRNLGAVAGIGILTAGLQESDKYARTLATTVGGLATGFALGGPVGAAIGGLGGLFLGLSRDTKKADDAASSYLGTLDAVTAKATEATRAQAVKALGHRSDGWTEFAAQQGIPTRAIVNAMTGPVDDFIALRRRLSEQGVGPGTYAGDRFLGFVKDQRRELGASQQTMREQIATTKDYGSALASLPPGKRTKIEADGIIPTKKGVLDLVKKYDLAPRHVKTLVEAAGIPLTKRELADLTARAKEYGRQRPQAEARLKDAATKPTRAAGAEVDKFGRKKAEARVGVGGISGIFATIGSIGRALDNAARPRTATITVRRFANGGNSGIAGARAKGGPVGARRTYLVGERGPELFTPTASGSITPNHALRSAPTSVDSLTPASGRNSGRRELTITNWDKGTGFLRDIAEDAIAAESEFSGALARTR